MSVQSHTIDWPGKSFPSLVELLSSKCGLKLMLQTDVAIVDVQ